MNFQSRQRLYWRLAGVSFGLALAPLLAVALYPARSTGGIQIAGGWVLMVASLGLMVLVLKERTIASLGFLCVAVLSMYHGVSGALFALFPGGQSYRDRAGVASWATSNATLYAGLGIFALTVAYLFVSRGRKAITPTPSEAAGIEAQFRRISLRALLVWTLAALIYLSGIDAVLAGSRAAYWGGVVTKYMILPLVVVTVLRMIVAVRAGEMQRRRAVLYGFGIALSIVLLITRRQDLMVATFATVVLAAKWRLGKPSRRQVLVGGSIMLLLFMSLAMLRNAVGRYSLTHSSPVERISLVVNGLLYAPNRSAGLENAATDAGYRLDGNTFLAGMIQARAVRAETVDLAPFRIVAGLMIPSAIWSAKLSQDVTDLSPGAYFVVTRHLGEADYLITPLALFYAMGGLPFMLAVMVTVGAGLGWLDRLVGRRVNLATIAVAACVAVALGQAEQDLSAWGLQFRAAMILSIALWLLAVRFRWHGVRHRRYS